MAECMPLFILDALFENMSLAKRHSTTVKMLDPTQLDAVKTALINRTATNELDSLAELGAIRWDLIDPSWNSLERESVIRNSSGLLSVRQNLFLILLYADVTKKDLDGKTSALSSVMGVAEVWRDPVDSANHHPVNIPLFQILESN
jgi:hypothetical protein